MVQMLSLLQSYMLELESTKVEEMEEVVGMKLVNEMKINIEAMLANKVQAVKVRRVVQQPVNGVLMNRMLLSIVVLHVTDEYDASAQRFSNQQIKL